VGVYAVNAGTWKARAIADRDVDEIAETIAADNVDAAVRFIHAVRDAYELLGSFPRAGAVRDDKSGELRGLRSWPLGGHFANYLILYLERDFGVEILRVVHGARDVQAIIDRIR
jgi:toxin ParE1/3/4